MRSGHTHSLQHIMVNQQDLTSSYWVSPLVCGAKKERKGDTFFRQTDRQTDIYFDTTLKYWTV